MARRSRSGPEFGSVDAICTEDAALARLAKRSRQLLALKKALWPHLAEELRPHCDIANYRDSTLVFTADSPLWAARLRHASAEILHTVRHEFKIPARRVSVKVVPPEPLSELAPAPRKLNPTIASGLRQAARACADSELQQAFERLARKGDESDEQK